MNIEYHKWYSPRLNQDMELKVYGWGGKAILVFPTLRGRFYEFEDREMVAAIVPWIEAGQVKVITVDSLDHQTWANEGAHPADRARRHEAYDQYVLQEVVPFVFQHGPGTTLKFLTTGCSMGGYHAANFFFRHPQVFDGMLSISGIFQLRPLVGDYMDEIVYLNSPLAYLPNLEDQAYLELYRQSWIVACAGKGAWDETSLTDALALKDILERKQVPATIDIWGHDVNHDWPWWRKMLPYFLSKLDFKNGPPANP